MEKNKRRYIISVIIMMTMYIGMAESWVSIAMIIDPFESNDGTGYALMRYNSENGLSSSEANAIAQDANGFIWIGGYSGLTRFDGRTFYRFDSSSGITGVTSLLIDSQERLWVGTTDSGVAYYENGEFTFFNTDNGLDSDSIKDIVEDRNGNIIIATTAGMAYLDTALNIHVIEGSLLNTAYIRDIAVDSEGLIAGVTLEGDIVTVKEYKQVDLYRNSTLPFSKPRCVQADKTNPGVFYFGTDRSTLVSARVENGVKLSKAYSTMPLTTINQVFPMGNNSIWICADNGIGYMDDNGQVNQIASEAFNNSIDNMMVDYEGSLWFTSSRQGVLQIVKNRFQNISLEAGLEDMVINATILYNDSIYIGSDTGLTILDQEYNIVENDLTRRLNGVRIRCIQKDSNDNLWICTYGKLGLIKYDTEKHMTYFDESTGLNSNKTRYVLEMKNGDIAVASNSGINIIRNDNVLYSYGVNNGLVNARILTLCEGENGEILAGSDGGGLFRVKLGEVVQINHDNGLKSDIILKVKKDPIRAGYWIITGNSIAYMEDDSIKTIDNFPYSNNFDIQFAGEDNIWILSGNGLYAVNGEALLNNIDFQYTFYNRDNGLPSDITANLNSYLDETGTLYIPGTTVLSSLNISHPDRVIEPVKLAIPFVSIDNEIIYLKEGENLVIPEEAKRLTLYAYALSFTLRDPEITYYLKGFDDKEESITMSKFAPISYTNLRGQEYEFYMKVNNESGDLENQIVMHFKKEKSFMETTWFAGIIMSSVIMLITLIAYIYILVKNKALLRKEEKNKLFIHQVISAFSKTIDVKDKYTKGHSSRVSQYASLIAKNLGYSDEEVEHVKNIALLHDVGKIVIPDHVLNKKGRLTDEEYEIMKQHVTDGHDILSEITSFPDISIGARYHHERIDGKGYPLGIADEEIPLIAKIIAVADTFDAMYSKRVYRDMLDLDYIVEELKRVSGSQLDESIVKIMLKMIEDGQIDKVMEAESVEVNKVN